MSDAGVGPDDLVLDVGAGHGALTRHLVDAGAHVVAIELHHRRVQQLRRLFADDPVTVVRADATELRLPRRPFRVVASPPYSISTALLTRLLSTRSRLIAADLVLQRAVVRRYAEGGAAGAGRWHRQWSVQPGRQMPRHAFRPPPRVDSAVLVIRRR